MTNPYLELTEEFNQGRLRALLSSGQAVVMHRLAVMSKDGDWILREDAEAMAHVLAVLSLRGGRYRFGAPLDVRWLAGGWSAHLEFRAEDLRVRTDFVTRPPRVSPEELQSMWSAAGPNDAVVGLEPLAAMKLTKREKDYPVVGELARQMSEPRAQLLFSRSSRDLIRLAREYPAELKEAACERPLLALVPTDRERLDEELDRERRALMREDERRLERYERAAQRWAELWPELQREIAGLSLAEAHRRIVDHAEETLPFAPGAEDMP